MTVADIVAILFASGLALALLLIGLTIIPSSKQNKRCGDCEHINPRYARYFAEVTKQEEDTLDQPKKNKKSSSKHTQKSHKNKANEKTLPKSYRKALSTIRSRATEIRSRTNDSAIEALLSSWEESVAANTRNYITLVNAPVKTNAIENAMHDIEKAVASVLPALDDMLAQTYDKQCMAATIEAGTLEAMIKQNRDLMRDSNIFSE